MVVSAGADHHRWSNRLAWVRRSRVCRNRVHGGPMEKPASTPPAHVDRMRTMGLSLVVLILTLCAARPANAASGQFVAHNTPSYVATAKKSEERRVGQKRR